MTNTKRGRPQKFKTAGELETKIEEYFRSCWQQRINKFGDPIFIRDSEGKQTNKPVMEQHRPHTVLGLALALGIDRSTLMRYEAKSEFCNTIKRAKQRIEAYAEESLYTLNNVRGVIFNLKNNWGWKS